MALVLGRPIRTVCPDGASIAIADKSGRLADFGTGAVRLTTNPLGDETLEKLAEQWVGRELRSDECERFLHHLC
ncbi:MAG TPA: hypothetical protein VGJ86_21100 [Acidimicrobiales bacterium]|jgi:hypothetical protein